jgi:HAD superfamily phosphoserine phosphatase-like hydrolase
MEIIKYQKGIFWFYTGFVLNSPFLILFKMGLISNQRAKERMLTFFFRKMPLEKFQQGCDDFACTMIPLLVRPKALLEIRKLKAAGAEVVIVSASAENWIQKWSDSLQLSLVASRLEHKNGLLTGKISGLNCNGDEKARRIREIYNLDEYSTIYGYGDTKGDVPMLGLASLSFYEPFR